ncbi:MAG: glycosyltransferase family 4 protein [Gemmatimonadota bacterium]
MRVLMITGDDLSAFRGGTIHLMEQAENLVRLGHEVTVFAPGRGAFPRSTAVPIRYLPAPGHGWLRLLAYNAALFAALLRSARRRRPHVIHTRQMGYSATPLMAARLLGLPHVLEVNGILHDELGRGGASRLRLWLIDAFARLNLRRTDSFSTTTAEHIDRLDQLYGVDRRRAAVVPCGVNLDLFRPGDRPALRRQLGLAPGAFIIVQAGSFYSWHGLDLLLDGLACLDRGKAPGEAAPDWQLHLLGDGAERPALETRARDLGLAGRVRFPGQVPYAQVPAYLGAADVGVAFYKPTRSVPGDPMKIYEYMACGLPVLASRYPNYGGAVERAHAGVSVDESDPTQVAAALRRLWASPDQCRQYGANGVRAAAAEYSWLARTRLLEKLLQQAARPAESPAP